MKSGRQHDNSQHMHPTVCASIPVHVWPGMVWLWVVLGWYGMVWYGLVWFGMVWSGLAWSGHGRYGLRLGRGKAEGEDADMTRKAPGTCFLCTRLFSKARSSRSGGIGVRPQTERALNVNNNERALRLVLVQSVGPSVQNTRAGRYLRKNGSTFQLPAKTRKAQEPSGATQARRAALKRKEHRGISIAARPSVSDPTS